MPRIVREVKPYWATSDKETVKLYLGDVIEVLRGLPSRSVQMVVTSPPYWGLRNYNAGEKEIGSERTPEEFVAKMVYVFGEVKRVLRVDGTVWLNLGDSYATKTYAEGRTVDTVSKAVIGRDGAFQRKVRQQSNEGNFKIETDTELANGNLTGVPWRVALALQKDGWVLRQDIIWAKPSPMPESITNRCTKAHEYLFLLTQSDRYCYDAEAIKSAAEPAERIITSKSGSLGQAIAAGVKPSGNGKPGSVMRTGNLANKRSVWTVSSQGYEGAHFAVFPPKLIEPTILAGTSEYGCCVQCGKGWTRVVDKKLLSTRKVEQGKLQQHKEEMGNYSLRDGFKNLEATTIGWKQQCGCDTTEVKPCTVLDPFIGSGTTSAVCIELGRYSVGIDLSENYLRNNAIPRIEGALLARPGMAHLTGRVTKEVRVGRRVGVRRG